MKKDISEVAAALIEQNPELNDSSLKVCFIRHGLTAKEAEFYVNQRQDMIQQMIDEQDEEFYYKSEEQW